MAIKCGFFNSIDRDRTYSAEDMNEPYKGILSNGIITGNAEEATETEPSLKVVQHEGLKVKIKAGRGIFANRWFLNDSDEVVDIPPNHTNVNTLASVIVRVDTRADYREATFVVRQANDAVDIPPLDPTLGVYEYRLANITIRPGVVAISDIDIYDTRLTDDCGVCHGLVKELSTEEIYAQWQAMFNDWFEDVQVSLKTQATLVTQLTSKHTTTSTTTIVPINIAQYNRNLDALKVYINGLELVPGTDYTIDSNTQITLTKSIYGGNVVSFTVLKSIDGSQAETIVQQFQDLQQVVNEIYSTWTTLTIDTGWISLVPYLENNVEAAPGDTPQIRRVGNQVYIRGAVRGVSLNGAGVLTIPEEYRPLEQHYMSTVAGSTGSGATFSMVRCRINKNGLVVTNGVIGTLNANHIIPLATSYLLA